MFGRAASTNRAGVWVAELIVYAEVDRQRRGVDKFTSKPLVEEVVQTDLLPPVLDADRPVVRGLHKRFEIRSIPSELRISPAGSGRDCDENAEQRPFSPVVSPEQICVFESFLNRHDSPILLHPRSARSSICKTRGVSVSRSASCR